MRRSKTAFKMACRRPKGDLKLRTVFWEGTIQSENVLTGRVFRRAANDQQKASGFSPRGKFSPQPQTHSKRDYEPEVEPDVDEDPVEFEVVELLDELPVPSLEAELEFEPEPEPESVFVFVSLAPLAPSVFAVAPDSEPDSELDPLLFPA